MAIDPVCGMNVDPKSAAGQFEFRGKTYYFCSTGCKQAFEKEPERYVDQNTASDASNPPRG